MRWLGLLQVPVALLVAACGGDAFPDYHYRMTIYADDKAFSSVRAIEQREVSSMVDSAGRRVERKLTGEAVILDLPGGTYYALLSKPDNADYASLIPGAALARHIGGDESRSDAEQAMNEARDEARRAADPGYFLDDIAARSRAMTEVEGAKDLPRTLPPRPGRAPFQAWPMFVTFGDPQDPRTVREVSPDSIGVSRITIEITDEDVTTGIENKFSWWTRFQDRRYDGSSEIVQDMRTLDLRNWLTNGQFSTEEPE